MTLSMDHCCQGRFTLNRPLSKPFTVSTNQLQFELAQNILAPQTSKSAIDFAVVYVKAVILGASVYTNQNKMTPWTFDQLSQRFGRQ
jgi:hypothetical protein